MGDVLIRTATLDDLEHLCDVLVDCVEGGASVSFMSPLDRGRASDFWRTVLDSAQREERVVLVAVDAELGVVGTVQLVFAEPENQPHRADVAKLLLHRAARGRGVADRLMEAAEDAAWERGRTVLVLDTASAAAERVYERRGWVRVGVVPDYALLPDGGLVDTAFYYKRLTTRR